MALGRFETCQACLLMMVHQTIGKSGEVMVEGGFLLHETGFIGLEESGFLRFEAHGIDAEAGIDLFKLRTKKSCQVKGIIGGTGEARRNNSTRAIGAVELEEDTDCAHAFALKPVAKPAEKLIEETEETFIGDQRLDEGVAHREKRRRLERREGLVGFAQTLIETQENMGGLSAAAETAVKLAAGNAIEARYGFQAEAFKEDDGFAIEPQSFDGKLSQPFAFMIVRHDKGWRGAEAGEGPGCA